MAQNLEMQATLFPLQISFATSAKFKLQATLHCAVLAALDHPTIKPSQTSINAEEQICQMRRLAIPILMGHMEHVMHLATPL